ncbi:cation diffusion facilitator family transporter [Entomobacter blattae]|nr:cation diffusion facilitator family transporter [Entomobacter blattae]
MPLSQHDVAFHTSSKIYIAWISVGVSLLAFTLKYAAWTVTGSVALYSDALETVINIVAAFGGLIALYIASKPADDNHTYGHFKAEYLSSVMESAMVVVTAVSIAREAWISWQHPIMPDSSLLGITLNGTAGVLNFAWARILLNKGARWRSPALTAAGRHVMSDVWTSLTLVCTFSLVPLTGFLWIDPLLASLIACNILRVGFVMIRHSIGGLMDEAPDTETRATIRTLIQQNGKGAIEAHDLRVRAVGAILFIDFHLVVPAQLSVENAHTICDHIEHALKAALGPALIGIHVEPEREAKNKNAIIISPCLQD